ncbi:hypothetical protein K7X08_020081 [Anisodus acutangulus]|uniref:Uncharacterized protein n=1 Tax=Anisodus acutangulus TaxID=402998 RepID=A0A9Q1M5S8_9SOLA|nr:hypothetical protein K7X08_020081 [Anisodus acutangulus]
MAVGANSRKRGREHTSATTTAAAMNPLMSVQSQPQLIDLTQLYTPPSKQQQEQEHQQQWQQTNVVSTGLQLAFGDQSHHHHQQKTLPQSSHQSSILFSILTDDYFASHIKQQEVEIEHFLQVQGEQLRRTLEEKRKRHYHALEESTARRLREKETEVEKATKRNVELEERASQLIAEARAWQVKANEQEVTAVMLQAQLQQAMIIGSEDAESTYIDLDRVVEFNGLSCKACRKRFASVVLLPCRHLPDT